MADIGPTKIPKDISLDDAVLLTDAYNIFSRKLDSCIKTVLIPPSRNHTGVWQYPASEKCEWVFASCCV